MNKIENGKVQTRTAQSKGKAGRPVGSGKDKKIVKLSPEQVQAKARKKREAARKEHKAYGGLDRQTLLAPQKEGFYRRFVRDDRSRVDNLIQRGYYFVSRNQDGSFLPTESLSEAFVKSGGSKENGSQLLMYLMEIPIDMYEEDQQAKEKRIRAKEDVIRGGTGDGTGLSPDVSYDPTEGKGQNNFFK